VALRTTDDAGQIHDQIHRLAGFLAAMTEGRTAAQVHAAIRGQLALRNRDERINGVADVEEFHRLWSALVEHSAVTDAAWAKVVLPTILVFSDDKALKANLEWATSQWLAIADSERTVLLTPPARTTAPVSWRDIEEPTVPIKKSIPPSTVPAPASKPRSGLDRRSKLAVAAAGTVLTIVVGAMAWQLAARDSASPRAGTLSQGLPSAPVPETAAAGAAPPLAATVPAPAPTWVGPAPSTKPAPPQQVLVAEVTVHSAVLRWDPPLDGGAAIAYYRIYRNGTDVGWTRHSSVTIAGLEPGTRYQFAVVAHDAAGLASAPAATVWAATPAVEGARTPTVATTPGSPITLGESFSVTGGRWPCGAPSQVSISLGGYPVALASLGTDGTFTATIAFEVFDKARPQLAVFGTGERLALSPGPVALTAELAGLPPCGLHAVVNTRIVVQ
jgi:hypothetical protein